MDKKENKNMTLEQMLKAFWLKNGRPSVIAARHTEFVVEPKIFIGDKLNPEVLKLLIVGYLNQTSTQDSGAGHVEVAPDKLVIKNSEGKPLVIVREKKIIQQYIAQQA